MPTPETKTCATCHRRILHEDWLCSLIFPHASPMQPKSASGQVGEHLAGHRVEVPITGPSFEQRSKFAEVRIASTSERQHEMAQHLLGDVQRFEVVFVEHGKPHLKMVIEGADAVAAVTKQCYPNNATPTKKQSGANP